MPIVDLPSVPAHALQREFFVDDARLEVTSLDMPAHGAFLLAGCSNGMVLLFDLTESAAQRNGVLLAQIRARGMHTNLRLTIKVSEDSRMCFAGVMKGSSELVAIDMSSYLVDWAAVSLSPAQRKKANYNNSNDNNNNAAASNSSSSSASAFRNYYHFENFTHSDAKLRGFGAATCWLDNETVCETVSESVREKCSTPTTAENDNNNNNEENADKTVAHTHTHTHTRTRTYLLACGMGIKNVHVWQLRIRDDPSASSSAGKKEEEKEKRDEWQCVYDVASNGMTITHLGFRLHGREMLTKSNGMNLRVWDLSKHSSTASAPFAKPLFEDIPNTHDVRCLLESSTYACGGTYEFVLVKTDKRTSTNSHSNNRSVYELPERPFMEEDEAALAAGLRRRRTMREVQDVIGTQDGVHVLVLCSDGGVMYYRRAMRDTATRASSPANVPSTPSGRKSLLSDFASVEESSAADDNDDAEEDLGVLQELSTVQRVSEEDQAWAVKRIGATGQVVLLRAAQNGGTGRVSVSLLSNVLKKEPSLPIPFNEGSVQWHSSGLFYQSRILPQHLSAPVAAITLPAVANVPKEADSEKDSDQPKKLKEKEKEKEKERETEKAKEAEKEPKKVKKTPLPPTPSSSSASSSTPGGFTSKESKPSPISITAIDTPQPAVVKKPLRLQAEAQLNNNTASSRLSERPPRPFTAREREREKEKEKEKESVKSIAETPSRSREAATGSCPSTPQSRSLAQTLFTAEGTPSAHKETTRTSPGIAEKQVIEISPPQRVREEKVAEPAQKKKAVSSEKTSIAENSSSSNKTKDVPANKVVNNQSTAQNDLSDDDDAPKPVSLGRMPRAKRTLFPEELTFVKRVCISPSAEEEQRKVLVDTLSALVKSWQRSIANHAFPEDLVSGPLSPSMLLFVGSLLRNQTRIHSSFLADVALAVQQRSDELVRFAIENKENEDRLSLCQRKLSFLSSLCAKYKAMAADTLQRQNAEYAAMLAKEEIETLFASAATRKRGSKSVAYKYEGAFPMTEQLRASIVEVLMMK